MKCVTVMSSTLAKYRRWDASFYTGDFSERQKEIERAQHNLHLAKLRLVRAINDRRAEEDRIDSMIAAKEIMES